MGAEFASDVLGVEHPKVGLLSIGEEASKGNQRTVEAHALLSAAPGLDFAGNCEGRDVLTGAFQVVVADGFAGNVLLKGLEGAAVSMFSEVRRAASTSLRAKIGGLLLRPALVGLRERTDPEAYGGAYLLGVRGLAVIAHGNVGRRGIANAIRYAARGLDADVVGRVGRRASAAAPGSDLQADCPGQYSLRRRIPRDWRSKRMNREEALERVRGILVEQLGVDEEQVTEDASFQADLDADSLDLVELIMELEDQFGLKISDEDAQQIATVGQAVDYVVSHS